MPDPYQYPEEWVAAIKARWKNVQEWDWSAYDKAGSLIILAASGAGKSIFLRRTNYFVRFDRVFNYNGAPGAKKAAKRYVPPCYIRDWYLPDPWTGEEAQEHLERVFDETCRQVELFNTTNEELRKIDPSWRPKTVETLSFQLDDLSDEKSCTHHKTLEKITSKGREQGMGPWIFCAQYFVDLLKRMRTQSRYYAVLRGQLSADLVQLYRVFIKGNQQFNSEEEFCLFYHTVTRDMGGAVWISKFDGKVFFVRPMLDDMIPEFTAGNAEYQRNCHEMCEARRLEAERLLNPAPMPTPMSAQYAAAGMMKKEQPVSMSIQQFLETTTTLQQLHQQTNVAPQLFAQHQPYPMIHHQQTLAAGPATMTVRDFERWKQAQTQHLAPVQQQQPQYIQPTAYAGVAVGPGAASAMFSAPSSFAVSSPIQHQIQNLMPIPTPMSQLHVQYPVYAQQYPHHQAYAQQMYHQQHQQQQQQQQQPFPPQPYHQQQPLLQPLHPHTVYSTSTTTTISHNTQQQLGQHQLIGEHVIAEAKTEKEKNEMTDLVALIRHMKGSTHARISALKQGQVAAKAAAPVPLPMPTPVMVPAPGYASHHQQQAPQFHTNNANKMAQVTYVGQPQPPAVTPHPGQ